MHSMLPMLALLQDAAGTTLGAGLAVVGAGLAVIGAGIGIGRIGGQMADAMARQPEAAAQIQTAAIILSAQGGLIILGGWIVGWFFSGALGVEEGLRREFYNLLLLQCVIVGFSFTVRVFSLLLFAHHRIAFTNVCQICGAVISASQIFILLPNSISEPVTIRPWSV